jgi:hypothetical protein
VYVGHAAVALGLKAREPRVPLAPLVVACYGPDCLDAVMMIVDPDVPRAVYTHSIPAVLIGAAAFSALYALVVRRPGAMQLFVGWLLHWPADLFTGRKPLFGAQPLVGLGLYDYPRADLALETLVILIGCAIYARAFARTSAARRRVLVMTLLLVVIQAGFDFTLAAQDGQAWGFALAPEVRRPHLTRVPGARYRGALRMPLALAVGTFSASERWPRTAPRV